MLTFFRLDNPSIYVLIGCKKKPKKGKPLKNTQDTQEPQGYQQGALASQPQRWCIQSVGCRRGARGQKRNGGEGKRYLV
ncbi:hypothetical protein SBOR_5049 [Sclerotinia borealis F-4128]|uniref:Uncharacterized protein n=1 Tax=Sclerotinia borealis (strain F-4128) TaxID=1432307 RepID=W9CIP5_SCLBF|nr:hypothetical protein SBOR_5049 [Sclerotinia borealis F-4128]